VSAQATVVITTKNRRDELRLALDSVLKQQGVELEVLVWDDGSTDGTADMVRAEYPVVRVHREPESVGLIVARNRAARLVNTPVVFSLDDDAEYMTTDTVAQTLRDLEHPRIGAVAIPHVDVNKGPEGWQAPQAPDRSEAVWVTSQYVGTAHAVRRDLFLELGGYREEFFHQGEELDFCLRMLDAGWWVRLGRAAKPIHHQESPKRDFRRVDVYGRRNEILHIWLNVPTRWVVPHIAFRILRGIQLGLEVGRVGNMLVGTGRGLRAGAEAWRRRTPVRVATIRVDHRLRREQAVRLEDIEPALHPPEAR
jgi:GT2 family glycosyltransferase